ncbi:hypothetical protein AXF42_Ash020004 [Apostasia shenzhenica]|uniref:KIB1-4 beta-propeller domain-containing protein n=1 Tax=Apostasia shenzhenica TaxID=1088818 RepID=A0A2H9ZSI8_9ASPA|nr:hypothetical protein AXF42_Ash020004 [Apostasia shenzhenica]
MEEAPSIATAPGDADGVGGDGRRWLKLPDLALHSIAMRLRGPAEFLAFCGVCRAWRSADSRTIAASFFSSMPPLVLLFPRSCPSVAASFYSLADDAIYNAPSFPGFDGLAFFGQSNGYLIGLDSTTGTIPSIANPLTGSRIDLPAVRNPVFTFAILTAPLTSPNCRLMLCRMGSLSYCPVGGSEWILHFFPSFRDAIFFRGRLYLTHLVEADLFNPMRVRVVEYDLEARIKREIFYGRSGLLVESSEEELLLVHKEQGVLVGVKLLPRTEGDMANDGVNWPGPGERTLFLSWQRSDMSSSCLMADKTGRIRKKYTIHPTSPFWSNYFVWSQVRSNGFYVYVDSHGRVEVSKLRPGWLPMNSLMDGTI